MFSRILAVILVASGLVLLLVGFRVGKQNELPSEELQRVLAQIALKSLKAQYELLESGSIPQLPFVSLHEGETHSYRSGEQRIEAALGMREAARTSGKTYMLHELNWSQTALSATTTRSYFMRLRPPPIP